MDHLFTPQHDALAYVRENAGPPGIDLYFYPPPPLSFSLQSSSSFTPLIHCLHYNPFCFLLPRRDYRSSHRFRYPVYPESISPAGCQWTDGCLRAKPTTPFYAASKTLIIRRTRQNWKDKTKITGIFNTGNPIHSWKLSNSREGFQ